MEFNDGTKGKYNIGHERAERYWNMYKDYFNSFDVIITSDTAPISRVFLQNNFQKKLIIWICNRFDYHDSSTLDCNFPDKEYYDLIRSIKDRPNVTIAGNSTFEIYYAEHLRQTPVGNLVINPIGQMSSIYNEYVDSPVDKPHTFWIPQYHNETKYMNLSEKLTTLGIPHYNQRHGGLYDLKDFKGIIHIPYAWSTISMYESIQLGMIYFIPSLSFLFELSKKRGFWFQPPFKRELVPISEWYSEANTSLFVFFDSWEDLKQKVEYTNYDEKKQLILAFANNHEMIQIEKWRTVLTS
jgi:hypothetical protein